MIDPTPDEIKTAHDYIFKKLTEHIPAPSVLQLRCMLQIIIKTLIMENGVDTEYVLHWVTADMNSAWFDLKEKQQLEGMKES